MRSFFPEYYLTAETPNTLVRDVAPIRTQIYGAATDVTSMPLASHRSKSG